MSLSDQPDLGFNLYELVRLSSWHPAYQFDPHISQDVSTVSNKIYLRQLCLSPLAEKRKSLGAGKYFSFCIYVSLFFPLISPATLFKDIVIKVKCPWFCPPPFPHTGKHIFFVGVFFSPSFYLFWFFPPLSFPSYYFGIKINCPCADLSPHGWKA